MRKVKIPHMIMKEAVALAEAAGASPMGSEFRTQ